MNFGQADICEMRRPSGWLESFPGRSFKAGFARIGGQPLEGGAPAVNIAAELQSDPVTLLLIDDDAVDVRAVHVRFANWGSPTR